MTQDSLFERTPSEKSTWELREASMEELIEAFDTAMKQPSQQDPDRMQENAWAMPERVLEIGHLVVSETIRVLRLGTRSEVMDATGALTSCAIRHNKETLERPFSTAFADIRTASHVIAGTIMPAKEIGRGYDLLRESREAARIVCILAEADRLQMTRKELQEALGYSPNLRSMDHAALIYIDSPPHDPDDWSSQDAYHEWYIRNCRVGLAAQARLELESGKPSELLAVARLYAEYEPEPAEKQDD